ncbi:MAG: hypothetical protein AAFX87_02175 [Bacteroidota bacterium]
MEERKYDIEQIEKYLEGKLTKAEQIAFEEELSVNAELKEELEAMERVVDSLKDYALKSELQEFHQLHFGKKRRFSLRNPYFLSGIAASFILILISVYLIYFSSVSSAELYGTYFEPYPNLVTTRGDNFDVFSKAMQNYSAGRYEEALIFFKRVATEDVFYQDKLFYAGVSHMAIQQYDSAIFFLNEVKHDADNRFKGHANWYLGLAYLGKNECQSARDLFEAVKPSEFNYKEAQNIVDILK